MNHSPFAGVNNPVSVSHGVLTALASSALALVDPRSLNRGQRFLYRGLMTGLTAWVVHANLSDDDLALLGLDRRSRYAITAGLSASALALMPASERLDGTLHDALVRAGVRHPRAVMSAGVGALMAGSWWAARKASEESEYEEFDWEASLQEVPPAIMGFLTRVLSATNEYGAGALRSQLQHIRMVDESEGSFLPQSAFEVPDGVERAVPGTMTFPVMGRLQGPGGLGFDLQIYVFQGKVQALMAVEIDDCDWDDAEKWLAGQVSGTGGGRWDWLADVELFQETTEGLVPLR